jgi:hypothetical protein
MWRTALAFPNLAVPLSHFRLRAVQFTAVRIVQGRPTNGVGPGEPIGTAATRAANAAHPYSNVLSPPPASTLS